jgi:hypothetical protein
VGRSEEINVLLVMAIQEMGLGHAALGKLATHLGVKLWIIRRQAETKTTDRMIQKRKKQNEALRKKMRQADEDYTYGAGIAD